MYSIFLIQKEISIIQKEYEDLCYTLFYFCKDDLHKQMIEIQKNRAIRRLNEKIEKIENMLYRIHDNDTRLIVRLKLKGKKWCEISRELNYSQRACRGKYYAWLNNNKTKRSIKNDK